MWEMQQLRRRADAVDVDLISNQPEEMTLLSSSAQGLDEKGVVLVLPDPIGSVSALAYTRK